MLRSDPIQIGVIGAGTMGAGIAQLCGQRGFLTFLYDSAPQAAGAAARKIEESLNQSVLRGRLTLTQSSQALGLISVAERLQDLSAADLIVEAIVEDLGLKQKLFAELDSLTSNKTVLATNTSSLSVAAVARETKNPARVLGLHFFNPPPVMKLIEIVKTPLTDEKIFKSAWDFALSLGKTPIEVKDTPGFVVNRVMRPFYLEAIRLASEAKASFVDIDKAVKGIGLCPMGPFELMDFIGLDVNLAITKAIYKALGQPQRFTPPKLQEVVVGQGFLGRKTGSGFYLYENQKLVGENPKVLGLSLKTPTNPLSLETIWKHIKTAITQEAQMVYDEGVATKEAINTAIRLGSRFPKGPFEW